MSRDQLLYWLLAESSLILVVCCLSLVRFLGSFPSGLFHSRSSSIFHNFQVRPFYPAQYHTGLLILLTITMVWGCVKLLRILKEFFVNSIHYCLTFSKFLNTWSWKGWNIDSENKDYFDQKCEEDVKRSRFAGYKSSLLFCTFHNIFECYLN